MGVGGIGGTASGSGAEDQQAAPGRRGAGVNGGLRENGLPFVSKWAEAALARLIGVRESPDALLEGGLLAEGGLRMTRLTRNLQEGLSAELFYRLRPLSETAFRSWGRNQFESFEPFLQELAAPYLDTSQTRRDELLESVLNSVFVNGTPRIDEVAATIERIAQEDFNVLRNPEFQENVLSLAARYRVRINGVYEFARDLNDLLNQHAVDADVRRAMIDEILGPETQTSLETEIRECVSVSKSQHAARILEIVESDHEGEVELSLEILQFVESLGPERDPDIVQKLFDFASDSYVDDLTGLLTPFRTVECVGRAAREVLHDQGECAYLLVADGDAISGLNEHFEGNREEANNVLVELSECFRDTILALEERGAAVVMSRQGGDEFLAIVVGFDLSPGEIEGILRKIEDCAKERVRACGLENVGAEKHGRWSQLGLTAVARPIRPDDDAMDVFAKTGRDLSLRKRTRNRAPHRSWDGEDWRAGRVSHFRAEAAGQLPRLASELRHAVDQARRRGEKNLMREHVATLFQVAVMDPGRMPMTGFGLGSHLQDSLGRAQLHIEETGESAVYGAMIFQNLKGLNDTFDYALADELIRKTMHFVQDELRKLNPGVICDFIQHTGSQFSVVVVGEHVSEGRIEKELESIQEQIEVEFAQPIPFGVKLGRRGAHVGLLELEHPGDDDFRGAGVVHRTQTITAATKLDDLDSLLDDLNQDKYQEKFRPDPRLARLRSKVTPSLRPKKKEFRLVPWGRRDGSRESFQTEN